MKVFSIRDSKADAHVEWLFSKTTETATRAFRRACNEPGSQYNRFPEDFCLFELGQADEVSGTITPLKQPLSLGLGVQFIDKPEPPVSISEATEMAQQYLTKEQAR